MNNNTSYMLDASALLACILEEPGAEMVENTLNARASITSVNLSEVIGRLLREGMPMDEVHTMFSAYPLEVMAVEASLAYRAAALETYTRGYGLSLGDRICLAAAQDTGYTVITADRMWCKLQLPDVTIQVIR